MKAYVNLQRDRIYSGWVHDRLPRNLRDRKKIDTFSASSRKRMVSYLRNSIVDYKVFITLTYPDGEGRDVKRCMDHLRKYGRWYLIPERRNGSIFWFKEWTERGNLHFHLYCTDYVDKYEVSQKWADIVKSKNRNHVKAGTNCKSIRGGRQGCIKYAAKYAAKQSQKTPPVGVSPGRYWGIMGCRETVSAATTWELNTYLGQGIYQSLHMQQLLDILVESGQITVEQYTVLNGYRVEWLQWGMERWEKVYKHLKGKLDAAKVLLQTGEEEEEDIHAA